MGCHRDEVVEPTVPPAESTEAAEKVPAPPEENTWVVIASKFDEASAKSITAFFDRLQLRDGIFDSRDGSARGFPPVAYGETEGHFDVEQTSQVNGVRRWKCDMFAGSELGCTLEWVRGGAKEIYILDISSVRGDPFEGQWRITLTPENGTGEELTGEATLHRAALDLTISGKTYSHLVYYVRPRSEFTPVDFLTVPPGQLAPISWIGTLMEGGQIVGWESLKEDGNYTIGGRLRISDEAGVATDYRVSSERLSI